MFSHLSPVVRVYTYMICVCMFFVPKQIKIFPLKSFPSTIIHINHIVLKMYKSLHSHTQRFTQNLVLGGNSTFCHWCWEQALKAFHFPQKLQFSEIDSGPCFCFYSYCCCFVWREDILHVCLLPCVNIQMTHLRIYVYNIIRIYICMCVVYTTCTCMYIHMFLYASVLVQCAHTLFR